MIALIRLERMTNPKLREDFIKLSIGTRQSILCSDLAGNRTGKRALGIATGALQRRLPRLGETYELVWASGWEDRANDHLPGILGVPELPYLTFEGRARFGTAHWKLDALDEYALSRPLAWIDDSLDASCHEWAVQRPAPTLLVQTESDVGLLDVHVEVIEGWAKDSFQPG